MATVPALRPSPLRIRTSPNELELEHNPFEVTRARTSRDSYQHDQRVPQSPPYNFPSDFSSYTARICPSTASLPRSPSSLSPAGSPAGSVGNSPTSSPAPSIKARISNNTLPSAPVLRRKISPTQITLRDIRESQKRLQAMQSEDQLRSVYERQTMEYLYGDFASLDGLQE